MTDPEDLRALWRDQPQETPPMTIAEVHEKATKFQRRVFVRNWIEYAAAAFVVATFGSYVFTNPDLVARIGAGVVVVGALIVVWQLHRRGSARPVPDASAGTGALLRAELTRQRDALKSVPLWYLAPLAPGMVLMLLSNSIYGRKSWGETAIALAFCAAVFAGVWWLNAHAARRLQAAIDEMDRRGAE